ncbi:MAG TPA: GldG family protein [Candidatus Polarisedimenticolaceae bacterium]
MGVRNRDELTARDGVDHARAAKRGAGSLAYAALVVGVVVVAILVSFRLGVRWDLSSQGTNVLSPMTVSALDGLGETVTVYALYPDSHPAYEAYRDLLELYRQRSTRVKFEFIDPVAQPGKVRELGVKHDQAGATRAGLSVAVRGDRRLVFRGNGEAEVTNALLEVGSDRPRLVGILRGYGELDPESSGDLGFARAVEALRQEYYDVRALRLSEGIPDTVTVLVVAGPNLPIPAADRAVLDAWLERGGRLLCMVEPGEDHGLNESIGRYGLRVTADRVLELGGAQIQGNPEFVRATGYSRHPIVRGFQGNLPSAFPTVAAVVHFEPGDPLVFHDAIVSSTQQAVALTPDGRREQGPFDFAAASWKRLTGTGGVDREIRVVAVGDAQFASNAYLAEQANRNLFLNMVGWLAQAEGLISIRRQPLEGQVFAITRGQVPGMWAAFLGPAAGVLLLGFIVFLGRRGR